MTRARVALLVGLATACRPTAPNTAPPSPITAPETSPSTPKLPARSPAEQLADLESRLVAGKQIEIVFAITSSGAMQSKLRGVVRIGNGRSLLQVDGTFAGTVGTAHLECDGTTLRGTSPGGRIELPCPAGMQPALMLGMTRMGLLHNIAMAWAGRPPDRSEYANERGVGEMDAWVLTQDHRAPEGGGDGIAFDIAVAGTVVGDATLVLDGRGLPASRTQTVRFDSGEMRVVEEYESVTVDGG
jgi:hypothetical protein